MPRSGGFLVYDDKTTDDRQTDCFTPCILLYLSISQVYSSILPSDAMVYLQWRTQGGAQGAGAPPSALAQQPVQ